MDEFSKLVDKYSKKKYPPAVEFGDIPDVMKYVPGAKLPKLGVHLGQRKLVLSEIQFMAKHPNKFCVYAGAAPSNKGYFLSQLFPETKFVMVDPRQFEIFVNENREVYKYGDESVSEIEVIDKKIVDNEDGEVLVEMVKKSKARLFLINGYFTNALAKKLEPLNANFVCDIRTRDRESTIPTDLDIIWNMAQQYNWVRILNPVASCVKFRTAFYQNQEKFMEDCEKPFYKSTFDLAKEFGVDFVSDYNNKKLNYLAGEVFLQAWPGPTSTETRLHVLRKDGFQVKEYDYFDYEDKLHFYNAVYRANVMHENEVAGGKEAKQLCVDYCNDCAIEVEIWKEYVEKCEKKKPTEKKIIEYMEKIAKYTKSLCGHQYHGNVRSEKEIKGNISEFEKEKEEKKGSGEKKDDNGRTVAVIIMIIVILLVVIVVVVDFLGKTDSENRFYYSQFSQNYRKLPIWTFCKYA